MSRRGRRDQSTAGRRGVRSPIPAHEAVRMVAGYARLRLSEQVRSVAFIIVYLVGFQTLILGVPPANAVSLAAGIGMVVLGLGCFLEGLLLGLMPLGERVGLRLPVAGGIAGAVLFGVLLGVGATYAEPAIAALRAAGSTVGAWNSPLLFYTLNRVPQLLVLAIGIGVGIAVGIAMIRFSLGLSIKPFAVGLALLLVGGTLAASLRPGLVPILGLAWDAGAVTTGPVTVPLVLALGIGVSRSAGRNDASGAFGAVMLASGLSIVAVISLGFVLEPRVPAAVGESEFFSSAHRTDALVLFEDEDALERHAWQVGSEAGRRSFYEDEGAYRSVLRRLAGDPQLQRRLLGKLPLDDWSLRRASDNERSQLDGTRVPQDTHPPEPLSAIVREELVVSLRAVVPLTLLLIVVLYVLLRDRPRHNDEVFLGISLALVGMALLTTGIRSGLAPLGDEVGRQLPRAFRTTSEDVGRVVIDDFDADLLVTSIAPDGTRTSFFLLDHDGRTEMVRFQPERFDAQTGRYEHVRSRSPLFGPELTVLGIGLVLLFAFGLGFGATLAEPALRTLGRAVEELTVGTIHAGGVVRAVALGVGVGLFAGVARILWDLPLMVLLLPPYVLLIPLTLWSEEALAGVAWDSGGVTTGVVTVPLVLSMGLGIGAELPAADGFGILALASVYPIAAVLLYGVLVRGRQRRSLRRLTAEESDA